MVAPVRVKFYYDIISPWSRLALELLLRYRQLWNLQIEYRPAFLGGISQASGNTGPEANRYKKVYNRLDMERRFRELGVILNPPDGFPHETRTLNAVRLLRVIQDKHPQMLEAATLRLYSALFESSIYPSSPAFFTSLTSALPSPIFDAPTLQALIEESESPANKERLKVEAKAVVDEDKCFGLPWMVFTRADGAQEKFWGSERMESIAFWLGEGYNYQGVHPQQHRRSVL
jgi:glutathione S-transferase kappa 1